ncbi:response regulator [Spirulina major CS-329]|uniref:response regulator n=1 Tax=Spirulina TaxID=1154 RepID=UPI00232CE0B0|nr:MULTISPECIES: response regulator [Spirulina]MDB9495501.1 response regulator [Spirulina subsalsa CS-330]MDB9505152.1 response regulator [Spirulina major CS-329]
MASHKVLILDGDSVVRSKLRRLLPPGSYEIAEASDGESGLALIHQERGRIRFILLNAALAKVSGWDVVAHLKADSDFQQIPLVVMRGSQRQDPDLTEPIYAAVEVLDKPFERSQLKRAVKTAIQKAKALNPQKKAPKAVKKAVEPAIAPPVPEPPPKFSAPEPPPQPPTVPPDPVIPAIADNPPTIPPTDPTPVEDLDPTDLENAFEDYVDFGNLAAEQPEGDDPFAGLDDFMAAAESTEALDLPEELQLIDDFEAFPHDLEQPPFDPTSGFTQPFIRPQAPEVQPTPAPSDPAVPTPYTRDTQTPPELELEPEDLVNSPALSSEFSRGGMFSAPPVGEFYEEDEAIAPAPRPSAVVPAADLTVEPDPVENTVFGDFGVDEPSAPDDAPESATDDMPLEFNPEAFWNQEPAIAPSPAAFDPDEDDHPFEDEDLSSFLTRPAALPPRQLDAEEENDALFLTPDPDPPPVTPSDDLAPLDLGLDYSFAEIPADSMAATNASDAASDFLAEPDPAPIPDPIIDPSLAYTPSDQPDPEIPLAGEDEWESQLTVGADPADAAGTGDDFTLGDDFEFDLSSWEPDPVTPMPDPRLDADDHPIAPLGEIQFNPSDQLEPDTEENTVLGEMRSPAPPPTDPGDPFATLDDFTLATPDAESTILADQQTSPPAAHRLEQQLDAALASEDEELDALNDSPEYTVLEDKQEIDPAQFPRFSFENPDTKATLLQDGMVTLLGFDEVKMRFESRLESERNAALRDALDYGEEGYDLVINALRDEAGPVRDAAEQLIKEQLRKSKHARPLAQQAWLEVECISVITGHSHWVQTVAIANDNRTLVSGSKDSTIKTWDLRTGRETGTITGHAASVLSIAISPDGDHIISSSTDNTIRIWDIHNGTEIQAISGDAHHKIYVVALSPDGSVIISASADQTAKPEFETGLSGLLSYLPLKSTSPLLSLINFIRRSREIKLWDLPTGKVKGSLVGYSKGVTDLAITPKGDKVVSGSRDHTIKIWDLETRKTLNTLWGHTDEIRSVVVTTNGQYVVSGSRDRTIKIWDLRTGHVLRTLRGHSQSVTSIAISPDGKTIISGSRDATLRIWDFESGEHLNTLMGHTDLIRSVAISPDGRTIVSGSRDNTIRVWAVKG